MGDLLQEDDDVRAWYLADAGKHDVAEEAYREAVEYLKREFKHKTKTIAWIENRQSLEEIRDEAEQVEANYAAASAPKKTVLHFMRKISAWIMLYGQVLDTLAQHHPEYVSLAWGAAKFLLMGVLNHEKLTTGITQALKDVASVLPRMELHAKLYPTERMKDSMARLYAHILLFLRQAVKWFSRNSATRAISAIISPFEIKYKGLIDGIRNCAEAINGEADAATKAEIRGIHVEVRQNTEGIMRLDEAIARNHEAHEVRLNEVNAKLDSIRVEIKEIWQTSSAIQGTVQDTRSRVIDLQLNEVLNNLKPKNVPEEVLQRQQALVRRASPWVDDNPATVDLIRRLGIWISSPDSPLLILQANARAKLHAKELAIELISVIEPARVAVAWHLTEGSEEGAGDRVLLIRSFIFQIMRNSAELIGSEGLDAAKFQSNHSDDEWLELFCTLVARLPKCFLLVEMSEQGAPDILGMLEAVASRCVSTAKILVLGNGELTGSPENGHITTVITVQKPAPPPVHLRRPRTRQNPRALAWAGVKKQF
ncbi:hypothetical protein QBC47DRAFT_114843 [Echria macrotheca]|uniref:DUF7708 domain-containing protein n=1 Tax=Echria macrotheca TaxID=438768 RepID=A0AAJ0FG36_9PEZI|nr:hypothetical protein QBC47DRAFT_114843 [Echria macrotheca]